ncbi:hypothetical protein M427DRAFT_146664 [Gonapodya prolifera JEL478]|uniref:Uncharacterized protein n=1 Tax=Gonapodya prolifera (strain JEL478) TaxID=1344416 RepID=A0A139A9T1_GONPJ|nr:hypothetical protein M427DRAFT_146664 [Gonapodya prolifera JEL478]|eukprot:KXS13235.1 hypothetical protein M427DRAFT_146664 [Gonapodya prolifera JEL478]
MVRRFAAEVEDLKHLYRSALLLHKSFASLPTSSHSPSLATPPMSRTSAAASTSRAATPAHARSRSAAVGHSTGQVGEGVLQLPPMAPMAPLIAALEKAMTEAGAIIGLAEMAEGEPESNGEGGGGITGSERVGQAGEDSSEEDRTEFLPKLEKRRQVEVDVVRGILEEVRRERAASSVAQTKPNAIHTATDRVDSESEEDWDLDLSPVSSPVQRICPPIITTGGDGVKPFASKVELPPDSGTDVSAATPFELKTSVPSGDSTEQLQHPTPPPSLGLRTTSTGSAATVRARAASTGASSVDSDWDAEIGVVREVALPGRPRGHSVALAPNGEYERDGDDGREGTAVEMDLIDEVRGGVGRSKSKKLEFGPELMPVLVRRVAPLREKMSGYIREMQAMGTEGWPGVE